VSSEANNEGEFGFLFLSVGLDYNTGLGNW
jgi:hypothetical protein